VGDVVLRKTVDVALRELKLLSKSNKKINPMDLQVEDSKNLFFL
jgi:hypothetical protein